MRQSQLLAAEQFTYFIPLCMAGAYYYGMTLLIEFFGGKIVKGGSYVTS
jgi:polar amino acid transport system permease protein